MLKSNKSNNAFAAISTPSVENKPLPNMVVQRRINSFHRNATISMKNVE